MANTGNNIFLFLILNFSALETLLNPKIIKYATGGAISKKYLLSLITNILLKMKNAINHIKNII